MLFQSIDFAIFLSVVLAVYWPLRRRIDAQNVVLALASAVFYGWWGWRLLVPLAACTLVTYATGRVLASTDDERIRRRVTVAAVATNLALLVSFKYANVFLASVALPIGMSFYVFRAISYVVDVSRGSIAAERSAVRLFTFVAFFPYMLAGPVEQAKAFLPQLSRPRAVYAPRRLEAFHLILWGLFKKVAIADSLSTYVSYVFGNVRDLTGSTLFVGLAYFTLQLYADFSGYSDIARGVALLFGFEITQNFRTPFFARNIAEFWRRWHISLYTWLSEYLFTPLSIALRDWGATGVFVSILITFTLTGVWHGAGWGFVVWGLLHGLFFAPLVFRATGKRRVIGGPTADTPRAADIGWIALTLMGIMLANVFFRSPTVAEAIVYLRRIATSSLFSPVNAPLARVSWVAVLPVVEWIQRKRKHTLDIGEWSYAVRYPIYAAIAFTIFLTIHVTDLNTYMYFHY